MKVGLRAAGTLAGESCLALPSALHKRYCRSGSVCGRAGLSCVTSSRSFNSFTSLSKACESFLPECAGRVGSRSSFFGAHLAPPLAQKRRSSHPNRAPARQKIVTSGFRNNANEHSSACIRSPCRAHRISCYNPAPLQQKFSGGLLIFLVPAAGRRTASGRH